jgi:ABC-2 type transport system permease protein
MISVSFAIADFLTRGFDMFGAHFVKTGNFDRILLRPRSAALQLIGYDFRLARVGRLAQGLLVIGLATAALSLQWDAPKLALALWTVAGGVALFFGLMVFQAVLAFWTVESLEVMNVLTYGGVQAAQFPLSIYAGWFRTFLIFIVPLGCVAYFPVLAILGKPDPLGAPDWLLPLTPAAGFAFLALSFLAWRFGVSKYTSTGS